MGFWGRILEFYQHLPSHVSPYVFSVGDYSLRWYSVGYMFAFITAYFIVAYRLKTEKGFTEITLEKIETLFLMGVLGVIVGGRFAYVFIYGWDSFKGDIWSAFFPFALDKNSALGFKLVGFSGMSYHGGLLGVILAIYIFGRIYKVDFIKVMNLVAPGAALGYTWGRLGNFMNGELYGRITEAPWGMYFVNYVFGIEQNVLRHPSQLYEAFFEGIFSFFVLWYLRKKEPFRDYLVSIFIGLYGFVRFFIEFFRQPDSQFKDASDSLGLVLGFMTMGQVLSVLMMLFALVVACFIKFRKKKG